MFLGTRAYEIAAENFAKIAVKLLITTHNQLVVILAKLHIFIIVSSRTICILANNVIVF